MKCGHSLMEGRVWHSRHGDVHHAFGYPLNMVLVDLDQVDSLTGAHPLWGASRRPVTLRNRDFIDASDSPIAGKVRHKAAAQGLDFSGGRLLMLAQPRGMGWLFNPIVIYWHLAPGSSEPGQALAEVRNTPWHERHWYPLVFDDGEMEHPKDFHVSPFMPMELSYRWQVQWGDPLVVRLQSLKRGEVVFEAGLRLRPRPATSRTLGRSLLRYMLGSLRTSWGIYRQAFSLWRKGAPFYTHPGRPGSQGGSKCQR